ncbi:MAG: WXG100 family type VII secretion target [Trebonia sp.]
MGYLKVDVEGAMQIAATLKQNAEARQSDIASLTPRVEPAAVWEGDAATAYSEKYQQWRSAETNLVNALEELSHVVGQIITNFDMVNKNGASAMQA